MGRISVSDTLAETLVKSEVCIRHRNFPDIRGINVCVAQVVVESVFEDLTLKKELFNSMGGISKLRAVPPDQVLLCSNTMAIPMSDITEEVCKEYRGSCIGMRFLHPVWFIDEVFAAVFLFANHFMSINR